MINNIAWVIIIIAIIIWCSPIPDIISVHYILKKQEAKKVKDDIKKCSNCQYFNFEAMRGDKK